MALAQIISEQINTYKNITGDRSSLRSFEYLKNNRYVNKVLYKYCIHNKKNFLLDQKYVMIIALLNSFHLTLVTAFGLIIKQS